MHKFNLILSKTIMGKHSHSLAHYTATAIGGRRLSIDAWNKPTRQKNKINLMTWSARNYWTSSHTLLVQAHAVKMAIAAQLNVKINTPAVLLFCGFLQWKSSTVILTRLWSICDLKAWRAIVTLTIDPRFPLKDDFQEGRNANSN